VTILIFLKLSYRHFQRESPNQLFLVPVDAQTHTSNGWNWKKKVKTCLGTLLQCTENVVFSLLMNRGSFTKWLSCGLCYEESLLRRSGLRGRMRFLMTKNGTFKKSRASFGKVYRVAWERCLSIVMKSLIAKHRYLRSFDKVWCR
jgi:hypothetical protein